MVVVHELLQCDDCNTRAGQAVGDDQIGLLADGGTINSYCKKCRRLTYWRYPHVKRYAEHFAVDPLLETFEQPKAQTEIPYIVPDPLLVGFDGMQANESANKTDYDWYG